jgi:hypothetical protein
MTTLPNLLCVFFLLVFFICCSLSYYFLLSFFLKNIYPPILYFSFFISMHVEHFVTCGGMLLAPSLQSSGKTPPLIGCLRIANRVIGLWFCRGVNTSVVTATDYGLVGRGSISVRGRTVSLLHSVQTGSRAHPASYPMVPGFKAAGA